jgi:ectoine hydroxylase-related dioxygenase (phytanoyl-CoA dioxygenase family)
MVNTTHAALAAALLLVSLTALLRMRRRGPAIARRCRTPPSVPRAHMADDIAAAVRAEGVCVADRVLDAAAVETLRSRVELVEPRKLQNRRAHRWEHVHSPEAAPFADLAALPEIAAVVRALLGPKTYLEKAGLLVSHPGADAQRWHMDTPHLFSVRTHLPPHSLSVFVPLVDLVPSNGPTEFQLATHIKAKLVVPQRHVVACCPAGSLVVYDVRIMHRGGPNASVDERPVVYLTFSRIWYRDTLNP